MQSISSDDIIKAKSFPIEHYLNSIGVHISNGSGRKFFCLSPLTDEKTPSFRVDRSSNRFVDYSSGKKGDVIDLHMALSGDDFVRTVVYLSMKDIVPYATAIERKPRKINNVEEFDVENFPGFNMTDHEMFSAYKYADSRLILRYCIKPIKVLERIGIAFTHKWIYGGVSGFKVRFIDDQQPKFYMLGNTGFCCFESGSVKDNTPLYICESETSSVSLFYFFLMNNFNAVVITAGGVYGVSSIKSGYIPMNYSNLKDIRVIIDYDGDEEKYKERISQYEKFGGRDIRLVLNKGEDLNTLLVSGKIFDYKNVLL